MDDLPVRPANLTRGDPPKTWTLAARRPVHPRVHVRGLAAKRPRQPRKSTSLLLPLQRYQGRRQFLSADQAPFPSARDPAAALKPPRPAFCEIRIDGLRLTPAVR